MFLVVFKLKVLKVDLKKFNNDRYMNIEVRVISKRQELDVYQLEMYLFFDDLILKIRERKIVKEYV